MFLSHLTKSIFLTAGVTVSNLILINSVHAFNVTFTNGGFETPDNLNNWSTIGDVSTTGIIDGIAPISGNQAIITTGYIPGTYNDIERDDDNGLNFNQSGNNPVSSDTDPDKDFLQEHFGFGTDAFSINRVGGDLAGITPRTSKEGSGMYQQFEVTLDAGEDNFTVSFDWAYLTNDGSTTVGGEQDFAFWSLGQYDSGSMTYTTAFPENSTGNPADEIEVLISSSSGTISEPTTANDYKPCPH